MDDAAPASLRTRLLLGAIAGFVATAAMTSAMARLHRRLPDAERYPLPPRETTEVVAGGVDDALVTDEAMAAHFLYGAATGAIVAAIDPRPGIARGMLAGVGIWAGSYFGWVPGLGILKPASDHPARRNALMIGAHLVWGSATSLVLHELNLARETILKSRGLRDAAVEAET